MAKKIKFGMIGGSSAGFIGAVHRMAAALDGEIELVCGAFSSHPERSEQTGKALHLDMSRVYGSYEEMIEKEKSLPENVRMNFVSIVTPNNLHFLPAKLALENGFHVFCEKPLAFSSAEAEELEKLIHSTGLLFGLAHTYTGYPMVKEAKELVLKGKIGKIRKVVAEYHQGWLSSDIESTGQKQASWRTDPGQSGISCCVGDIGTHAENLAEYITGLKITELSADISTFVDGRKLEDDANIFIHFEDGAKGVIMVSQIACGEENELNIKIYGETGGIEWRQTEPNRLILKSNNGVMKVLKTGSGNSYLSERTLIHARLPGGHPEGYIEAMANIYRNFAYSIHAFLNKEKQNSLYDFQTIEDGQRGMRFIDAVIDSGKNNSKWIKL